MEKETLSQKKNRFLSKFPFTKKLSFIKNSFEKGVGLTIFKAIEAKYAIGKIINKVSPKRIIDKKLYFLMRRILSNLAIVAIFALLIWIIISPEPNKDACYFLIGVFSYTMLSFLCPKNHLS